MKKLKKCLLCGGTGWLWMDRSWFSADGCYRQRCGICGGSGESDYRPVAEWVKRQREKREANA